MSWFLDGWIRLRTNVYQPIYWLTSLRIDLVYNFINKYSLVIDYLKHKIEYSSAIIASFVFFHVIHILD